MNLEADEMFLGCVCSGSYAFVLTTTSDMLAITSVFGLVCKYLHVMWKR